ncbi:hypothetical protein QZH41_014306 [Actinostola sp. cb2023]|nr:hypothetical protein QZH41_014306 [Actinostola sp. cb2023]
MRFHVFDGVPRSEVIAEAFVDKFSIVWRYMPGTLGIVIAGVVTMILGSALRGEWTLVLVLACKQLGIKLPETQSVDNDMPGFMESVGLKDVHWYVMTNIISSTAIYFTLGGFLQWYYYTRQRNKPEKWKCQPKRFLSREDEIHEVTLGAINMILGAAAFGVISCYIANGGYTTVYYEPSEKGWIYLILSAIFLFLLEDAGAYYYHRMLHWPFFYKRFHKMHHRYKAPTCFSATAMHPVEFFVFQLIIIMPVFVIPINAGVYVGVLLYLYYFGMIDHSGINLYSIVPWQPPVVFHDDHHKYFHCNFGFNSLIFDKLHGTLRRNDRYYDEDVFGGKGTTFSETEKQEPVTVGY